MRIKSSQNVLIVTSPPKLALAMLGHLSSRVSKTVRWDEAENHAAVHGGLQIYQPPKSSNSGGTWNSSADQATSCLTSPGPELLLHLRLMPGAGQWWCRTFGVSGFASERESDWCGVWSVAAKNIFSTSNLIISSASCHITDEKNSMERLKPLFPPPTYFMLCNY